MISFSDRVVIKIGDVEKTIEHNTMATDFFNVVSSVLAYGMQSANAYTYVTPFSMPSETLFVFVNNGIVTNIMPATIESASSNSVVLTMTDDSTNTYEFNSVQLWAGSNDILYYPIAYANLQQSATKQATSFVEITWSISWVPSSVFINIPSQLIQSGGTQTIQNPGPPGYPPPSQYIGIPTIPGLGIQVYPIPPNCNQPAVSALIMALMGLPFTNQACLYATLYGLLEGFGINGVNYIIFYDSNYNVVGYANGNGATVTLSGVPSYVLVLENAGTVNLPLLGGSIALPIQPGLAYKVTVTFNLSQSLIPTSTGITTNVTGTTSTSTTTTTSSTTGGVGACVPVRAGGTLHFICVS